MAPLPGEPTYGAPSARVLVVDDHRNTRESLALGLESLDLEVATAASPREALEALGAGSWDWLVCDIRMPRMSGIDLAARARALLPALGLILMTAYDVTADERRRISGLRAALLIKPVTADFLAHEYLLHRGGAIAANEDRQGTISWGERRRAVEEPRATPRTGGHR